MGYADGLGDLQTQHSCILLLDITENCNLECPTCFAAAAPGIGRFARLPHILRSLDTAIEREGGRVDVLMLSGGEPTVHPEILEIIEAATERNVTRVILNTNGIRIARDDRFVSALGRLRGRVEVYLQFDGFELDSHLYHRGEDLREREGRGAPPAGRRARLHDAGRGRRRWRQRRRGRRDRRLRARHRLHRRRRLPARLRLRPRQSDRPDATASRRPARSVGSASRPTDRVGPDDFIALPCSHPDCSSITYFVRGDSGEWRSVPKMLGTDRLKEYLGLVSNRIAPDDAMWTALVGMMSETTLVSRPELVDYLLRVCDACDLGVSGFLKSLGPLAVRPGGGRRGDRAAGQALLGQVVHGRLDAQRRAAPAMLRPRRLDRRRGQPGARPVLCAAALRRSRGARRRPAWSRRASSSCSTTCAAGARRPLVSAVSPMGPAGPVVGPARTSARRCRARRSTSVWRSRSAGWARSA